MVGSKGGGRVVVVWIAACLGGREEAGGSIKAILQDMPSEYTNRKTVLSREYVFFA